MNIRLLLFCLGITVFSSVNAQQTVQPKREFRAVWVASVTNIDWPSNKSLSTTAQKNEIISILDKHKANNINAILLQVRPSCDALYQGGLEPLSEWLVGSQGGNLSSYYDPLQFWIDEAHKRGMELHGWFNPYRSVFSSTSSVSSSHISKTHPEWNITYGSSPYKLLDPGIPDVRNYVVSVIMDVVRRYNIDGVHFDDYFYPYGGMTNQDDSSWAKYPRGFTNRGDWRRDNVNLFVRMVYDSIKTAKPWVKFGISPFGIWKNGVPSGISGLNSYSVIYCDAVNWISNKKVDYINPQLYWKIGGSQDYNKLMPWWSQQVASVKRHLYTGNAAYRLTDAAYTTANDPSEIQNQIELNRLGDRAQGVVFFSSKSVTGNLKNVQDSLRANQFRYAALPPVMPWLDSVPPMPPVNVLATAGSGSVQLQWNSGAAAADGETASRFVVYSTVNSFSSVDINDPKNIRFVTLDGAKQFIESVPNIASSQYEAVVTSLDKLSNESALAAKAYVVPAGKPFVKVEKFFVDFNETAVGQPVRDTIMIYNFAQGVLSLESYTSGGKGFSLESYPHYVADSTALVVTFSPTAFGDVTDTLVLQNNSLVGPIKIVVKGKSSAPVLLAAGTNIGFGSIDMGQTFIKPIALTNQSSNGIQVDSIVSVSTSTGHFKVDSVSLPKTIFKGDSLWLAVSFKPDSNKLYLDTINVYSNAQNSPLKIVFFGIGKVPLIVEQQNTQHPLAYQLEQNYPNPFNPSTTIKFSLERSNHTSLRVYDMLGREVAVVVDETLTSGTYEYKFNGENLSSGVYLFRITSGEYIQTKKMILQK
ncbi:MAG: family 10 glycosylhydrolase [Bacteroidetes bacterium]|nr:family 10 glycosylhydrolase [Bacteroidota bacterium]